MNRIDSLENKKIKDVVKLKKTRDRKVAGLIFVDGFREVLLALESGLEIVELFYCSEFDRFNNFKKLKVNQELVYEVSENVFRKICYKENPDGCLALIKPRVENLQNIKINKSPLVVILERVEKPGNLGAIIRTAYAAGVDLIIINDNQTDVYSPNVIRASEGLIFKQKIVSISFKETVEWLKEKKIASYAAATSGKLNYTKIDMKKSLAVILGSEADGLSSKWLKAADKLVKIPMAPGVDSLNVSVSAAILLYEALRQRNR